VRTNAAAPMSVPRLRCPRSRGAINHHNNATAAAGSSASASLTSNDSPRSAPAPASGASRRVRAAPTTTSAPATASAAIVASIVSLRAVTTADGRTASARPPARAAPRPSSACSKAIDNATSTTPASASGKCSANGVKPKSLVAPTCSHRSTGGLSIATRRPGSKAPAISALHDVPMLRTAAS
jgi:hypothetical protein